MNAMAKESEVMPPAQSLAMRFMRFFGSERIAWSLRRLYCPVNPDALVLEVGSGGNPYYRANVLLDAYENTGERHWVPLVTDRPMILGFVESLPFKNKVFDFVIASHVLEHSPDPEQFIEEMQRVSRAGYIEVPDAFMERINPYPDHRLEITVREGKLIIRKKSAWQVDPELVELYENCVKGIVTRYVIPRHPFDFHVRYYWKDKIDYEIINPDVIAQRHVAEQSNASVLPKSSLRSKVQSMLLATIRSLLSQHARNSKIDLIELLQCTHCQKSELAQEKEALSCHACGTTYSIRNGILDMTQAAGSAL